MVINVHGEFRSVFQTLFSNGYDYCERPGSSFLQTTNVVEQLKISRSIFSPVAGNGQGSASNDNDEIWRPVRFRTSNESANEDRRIEVSTLMNIIHRPVPIIPIA